MAYPHLTAPKERCRVRVLIHWARGSPEDTGHLLVVRTFERLCVTEDRFLVRLIRVSAS